MFRIKTRTLEEFDPNSDSGRGDSRNDRRNDRRSDCRNKSITKYSFKGKIKDGPISELTITETGYKPSQYKKLWDAFPVFCAAKNYGGLDEVLRTGNDQVEADLIPAYPDTNLWSHTHQIQIATVADEATLIVETLTERVTTYKLVYKTVVTNANLQQQLLLDYERKSKLKSQEYSRFLWDKKSLTTIVFGQYDEATQTEIALGDNYAEDRNEGRF